MKKTYIKILVGGGILTVLATPAVFKNISLQKKMGAPITTIKKELYAEQNILMEPNNIPMLTDISEITYYHSLVKEYCDVFVLDEEVVTQKVIELTDNYSNEEFNNNKLSILDMEFENKEQLIIYLIMSIDKNPSKFDLDSNVYVSNDYEPKLSCEDMVKKYSEIFNIDPKIPLSIIYVESYYKLNSYNCVTRHNPAGAGHIVYDNLEEGIIYHIINVRYRYANCGNDISFFRNAQSVYCPDNDGSWIIHNEKYYYDLSNDYYCYLKIREESEKVLVK